MNRLPIAVLAGAGVVLGALVLGEWISGRAQLQRIDSPAAIVAQAPGRVAASEEIGAAPDAVEAWTRTALARPLMSSTRQPSASASGPSIAYNGGLPRLSGTLSGADSAAAIFARGDDGHALVVHVGGVLGPYRVTRIAPGSVTLDGPGGPQTLHPRYDSHPAAPPEPQMPSPMTMPGIGPLPGPGQNQGLPFQLQQAQP